MAGNIRRNRNNELLSELEAVQRALALQTTSSSLGAAGPPGPRGDPGPDGADIFQAGARQDPVTTVAETATQTLTNKRITKRTGTTTASATPTINTDNVDFYSLTAQDANITSFTTNLSGTPTEAQTLWIAITATATRTITWGASFESSTATLPTTTVGTDRLDVGFVWNSVTSKWRCVAKA